MATLILNPATSIHEEQAARKTVVLSDGSIVCFIRATQTTILAYHSPDRINWTLKFTITVSANSPFSCAIDSANNIQVVYQTVDPQNLIWRYYTFSAGPSWAAGTAETIVASSVNNKLGYVDIDVVGTGATVACAVIYRITVSTLHYTRVRARSTGGSWGTEITLMSGSSAGANSHNESVTISADAGGVSGGVHRCYITSIYALTTGTTFGGLDELINVTVATGAIATQSHGGSNPNWNEHLPSLNRAPAYQYNNVLVFPVSSGVWCGVEFYWQYNNLITFRAWRAIYNGTTLVRLFTAPVSMVNNVLTTITKPTAIKMENNSIAVFARAFDGVACVIVNPSTAYISPAFKFLQGNYPWTPFAGAQRNVSTIADVILHDHVGGSSYHEENHVPATSTIFKPVAGEIINTDVPTLYSSVPNLQNFTYPRKVEFNIADDNLFTTNLKTLVEPDSHYDSSLIHGLNMVESFLQLSQGVRYARDRTIDVFGRISAWSPTNQFQVFHPPVAASLSPGNNIKMKYGTGNVVFSWTFTDTSPVDTQTAYQIIIENASDGTLITDTGKITSTAKQATIAIASGNKDIDLRWKISLWDRDNVQGPFSNYAVFALGDAPVIAITTPANAGTVTSPNPVVTWTFTSPRTQKTYAILVTNFISGRIFYSSGIVHSSDNSIVLPANLKNNVEYLIQVIATDTYGLDGTDTNLFTTVWTAPAAPTITVDTSQFDTLGYNLVAWTNASLDAEHYSWRLYRRLVGEENWTLVWEDTTNLDAFEVADWTLRANIAYEYVVVQTALRFGVIVESTYTNSIFVTSPGISYWLLHPSDANKNFKLVQVTSESVTDEYESQVLNIIGRGRKIDYGSYLGHAGTLTAQIYDQPTKTSRQIRLELEALQAARSEVYLRNPFGDLWKIDLSDAQITRIPGVGTREFHTLQVGYIELEVENDIFDQEALSSNLIDGIDGGLLGQSEYVVVDGGTP